MLVSENECDQGVGMARAFQVHVRVLCILRAFRVHVLVLCMSRGTCENVTWYELGLITTPERIAG